MPSYFANVDSLQVTDHITHKTGPSANIHVQIKAIQHMTILDLLSVILGYEDRGGRAIGLREDPRLLAGGRGARIPSD